MKKIILGFLSFLVCVASVNAQTFSVNNLSISGVMTGPQQPANTILANTANSTGAASPVTMPSCASGAVNYTPGTGFGCLALTTDAFTYTQGAVGSTSRTVTSKFQDSASILDFSGCDPTGVADSTTCIQNAFNAARNGLLVAIPPGTYNISSTLVIGNGSASGPSTTNGQVIEGLLGGGPATEVLPVRYPVQFKWTGASGGTMLTVNGPIWGVQLSGITFNAAGSAKTCVVFSHPMSSVFENLLCTGYTGTAFAHTAYAEPSSVVVGSSDNRFDFIQAKAPAAGGSGIVIGGTDIGTTKHLDVARNVYFNNHFDYDQSTPGTYGIALQFVDNVSFIETATSPANSGAQGFGLFVNPPTTGTGDRTGFPGNIQFYNSPLIGGTALPGIPANWNPPAGLGFWPYPTGDGEPLPTPATPGLVYGITDSGVFFGASGGTPVYNSAGTAQYNNHSVFGSVQLSGGAANVTLSGAAVYSNVNSYSCTATSESSVSAVKALLNSGSSITFNGSGSDFVNYICLGH